MSDPDYDIAIIGGGINGRGIAGDAVGRGYSVYLREQDDPGGATSCSFTRLLLSIFGGKITTCRRLAEAALRHIARTLGAPTRPGQPAGWTGQTPLPGGDFPPLAFEARVDRFHKQHAFPSRDQARRLV